MKKIIIVFIFFILMILGGCAYKTSFYKKIECSNIQGINELIESNITKPSGIGGSIKENINSGIIRVKYDQTKYSEKKDNCIGGFFVTYDQVTSDGEGFIGIDYYIIDLLSKKTVFFKSANNGYDENIEKEYLSAMTQL